MNMLREFYRTVLDILYPRICLACKKPLKDSGHVDNLVCSQCWAKIKRNAPPFCHRCGRHMEKPQRNICPECTRKELHFDRAFSPCVYDGVIKELIHAFKYGGKEHLAPALSRIMAEFIEDYRIPVEMLDMIIPVPLHQARLREREFNQAEILGTHLARRFNKALTKDTLKRLRHTRTQTELETDKRLLNVKGSFGVNGADNIKGKNILLVDDVLTSGATSSEAAYTLKKAGANIVFVLTLAN